MRTVAAYALESASGNSARDFEEVVQAVTKWLVEKGWSEGSEEEFVSTQGNRTRVVSTHAEPPDGNIKRLLVLEYLPEAIFSTEVAIANDATGCAVFVELRVEGVGPRLQPFRFDARRPKFLGRLLNAGLNWQLGETPLTDQAYNFGGSAGGDRAVEVIWHPERTVPVVMVSLIDGAGITSNFVTKLAGDLAGLAIVATIDEDASWRMTRLKEAEWSCFNGALRLYWPMGQAASQPRLHPLWLRTTMLARGEDPTNASYRMRAQLRRIILGVSALSVRQPSLIRKLDRAARQKRQDELREYLRRSHSTEDYREIAESYAKENDRLKEKIEEKEDQLSMLEDQVSELQLVLRYIPQDSGAEVPPDTEDDPRSVADAVRIARARYSGRFAFSEGIDDGILSLNQEAGPPSKILHYFDVLHAMVVERHRSGLGVGVVDWLAERGVTCSVESETIRKAGGRKWMVGGERVAFDYHLKPSDGVSPDRCVRIYFDLTDNGQARIGWIGRHPD